MLMLEVWLYLILNGLFWGNSFALSFAFIQKNFNIISLDESIYFMNSVPINLDVFVHKFVYNLSKLFHNY